MMLDSVPSVSSAWSGTGTVVVVLPDRCCMTMRLPRCRTTENPWPSRIWHTSRPERTRSLPNRDLDARDEHFAVQPSGNLGRIGGLEEQF